MNLWRASFDGKNEKQILYNFMDNHTLIPGYCSFIPEMDYGFLSFAS